MINSIHSKLLSGLIVIFSLVFTFGCQNDGTASNNSRAQSAATPLPAASPASNTPSAPPSKILTISAADAKKEVDAGTAVIIDVRSEEAYKIEHIQGALHIPIGELSVNKHLIPKGKKVIAYCSCAAEQTSSSWVEQAKSRGIDNAYALLGGTQGWINAGYPTEKTQ